MLVCKERFHILYVICQMCRCPSLPPDLWLIKRATPFTSSSSLLECVVLRRGLGGDKDGRLCMCVCMCDSVCARMLAYLIHTLLFMRFIYSHLITWLWCRIRFHCLLPWRRPAWAVNKFRGFVTLIRPHTHWHTHTHTHTHTAARIYCFELKCTYFMHTFCCVCVCVCHRV